MDVSPIGFDVGETHEALIRLRKAGFTPADLHRIAESDEIAQKMVEALRGGAYPVTVDYSKTIEEMVAAGGYNYANPDITTKNFPPKGKGIVEVQIQLVHFNRVMSSDAVLEELDKMGLKPVMPMEISALGAKYPDLQRQFPIAGLGQVWQVPNGNRNVLCLESDDRKRNLNLNWLENDWNENWRFAAVRKFFFILPLRAEVF